MSAATGEHEGGAPLALVAAMHQELAAVLALLPDERKTVVAGREFWRGHLHGREVIAVLSLSLIHI